MESAPERPGDTAARRRARAGVSRVLAAALPVVVLGTGCPGGHPRPPASDASPVSASDAVTSEAAPSAPAVEAFERSREEAARRHGPRSAEAARATDDLVKALWRAGRAAEPETLRLAEESVAIREATADPDGAELAISLNNLASILSEHHADHERAAALYARSLALREKAWGDRDPRVARLLSNLARSRLLAGDHPAAKRACERALEIWERSPPAEAAELASGLNNLALVLHEMGDHAAAAPLFERALGIWEATSGPRSAAVAVALNNLAMLRADEGETDLARKAFERAGSIWDDSRDADPKELGSFLNNRGWFLFRSGDVERARSHLERGLELRRGKLGVDHPDTIWTVRNLGVLEAESGDPRRGEALLTEALAARRKTFGEDHPLVAQDWRTLGMVRYRLGEPEEALAAALRAEEISREHVRLSARGSSERLSLRSAAVRASGLDLALAVLADASGAGGRRLHPGRSRAVLDALVRSRAVILDEMALRHRASAATDDPEAARLARELAAARRALSGIFVRGPGSDPSAYAARIADAQRRKDAAEEALAAWSPPFRAEQRRGRAGLDELALVLEPRSALVSFVRYEHPARGRSYLAFTLLAGEEEPRVVDLGDAGETDGLVEAFVDLASRRREAPGRGLEAAERDCRAAGLRVRGRVWDPVAARLEAQERVYLVPDGALHRMSLAALPSGARADGYLVEDDPTLHILSAERDLAGGGEEDGDETGAPRLLAVGGADYDFGAIPGPGGSEARRDAGEASRGTSLGGDGLRAHRFSPLPAALAEVEEVAGAWSARYGPGSVERLTGAAASERALRDGSPGRRAIHLATHGFYLGGDGGPPGTRGVGGLVLAEPAAAEPPASPLLLSGLALASANHRGQAGPEEDDGILTAEEVAALDLRGVEQVVLSACETALGTTQDGEGVLGLRRAFRIAGARTLVLALWSVEDRAAGSWMRAFYRSRLAEGKETAEAARQASLAVLRSRRDARLATHPFYWAGFIADGASR